MQENIEPQNLQLARSINISTVNQNGQNISESHKVTGPFNQDVEVVKLTQFNKAIIPLLGTLAEDDPVLKIHYPKDNDSRLFITYALKNSNYVDGFRDFEQGLVSPDFKSALKKWVAYGSEDTSEKERVLHFFAIGKNTNNIKEGMNFTVRFSNKLIQDADPDQAEPDLQPDLGG